MKFRKRGLFLIVCLCSLTITVFAQKMSEKPFQKWSKEEATKLLTHSPWAQTYQSQEGIAAASRDQIGREQSDFGRGRTTVPGTSSSRISTPIPVVIRLHSALPVRQALVRIRQLQAGYDKLSEKERSDFDKTTEGFLNCAICQKYYVVTLTRFVDASGQSIEEGVFQRMGLDQLKGNLWLLNEKGERRELVQFNAPKSVTDMAVFYFARQDEKGSSFLTPESKRFDLVFNSAFLGSGNPYGSWLPQRFEFNVTKLMAGNNLLF